MPYASTMQPKIFSDRPSCPRTRQSTGIAWGVSGVSLVSSENLLHRASQPKRGDVSLTLEMPVIEKSAALPLQLGVTIHTFYLVYLKYGGCMVCLNNGRGQWLMQTT